MSAGNSNCELLSNLIQILLLIVHNSFQTLRKPQYAKLIEFSRPWQTIEITQALGHKRDLPNMFGWTKIKMIICRMKSDGRITDVLVYGIQKRYEPEKHYVFILKISRENVKAPTYVFRTYKEFCELDSKLHTAFNAMSGCHRLVF